MSLYDGKGVHKIFVWIHVVLGLYMEGGAEPSGFSAHARSHWFRFPSEHNYATFAMLLISSSGITFGNDKKTTKILS